MMAGEPAGALANGLLVDANLLVLFIVGCVNPRRIAQFNRTNQYAASDYELLLRTMSRFEPLYTLPHIMAEVSNLAKLNGREFDRARHAMKDLLTLLDEDYVPSRVASGEPDYARLGLVDAAIFAAARKHGCTVLTDDRDLHLALLARGLSSLRFFEMRKQAGQF